MKLNEKVKKEWKMWKYKKIVKMNKSECKYKEWIKANEKLKERIKYEIVKKRKLIKN